MKKTMLLTFLIAAFSSAFSTAQEISNPAMERVKELIETAKTYKDEYEKGISTEEKASRGAVREKISSILDLKEMARLILKNHWAKLKDAQRNQYADLLSRLVERIGYPQIGEYFNKDLKIEYLSEKEISANEREVLSRITYPNDEFILSTKFLLKKSEKGWRIYDVITDGDSLLLIYRNQHMGIIKDKGFPELIKLMQKKLDSADKK